MVRTLSQTLTITNSSPRAGVRQEWSWRWIVERTNPKPRPLYNLLNVRYFLDMPSHPGPEVAPAGGQRLDLDVSPNEGEWPRAFFLSARSRATIASSNSWSYYGKPIPTRSPRPKRAM